MSSMQIILSISMHVFHLRPIWVSLVVRNARNNARPNEEKKSFEFNIFSTTRKRNQKILS
jgi:hypothetical protein